MWVSLNYLEPLFRIIGFGVLLTLLGSSLLYGFRISKFFSRFEMVFTGLALGLLTITPIMLILERLAIKINLPHTLLGFSMLMLLMLFLGRKKQSLPEIELIRHPLKARILLAGMLSASTLICLFLFIRYPIFHLNWLTIDPVTHASHTLTILSSGTVSQILPYRPALHCTSALACMIMGIEPFLTPRYIAGFIYAVTPVYMYLATSEMFKSWKTGLISAFFINFFFATSLRYFSDIGTWAALLADMLILAFLFLFFRLYKLHKFSVYIFIAFLVIALNLVHMESMMLVGLLIIFMVAACFKVKFKEKALLGKLLSIIFGVSIFTPYIVIHLLPLLTAKGGELWILGWVPALGGFYHKLYEVSPFLYTAWIHFNMPVGLLLVLVGCVLILIYKRGSGAIFSILWFVLAFSLSFAAWQLEILEPYRILMFSILPASMIGAFFLEKLLTFIYAKTSSLTYVRIINVVNKYLTVALIIVFIANLGSLHGILLLAFTPSTSPSQGEIHLAVYDSMLWIKNNVREGDGIASIEIPLYSKYYKVVVGKGDYLGDYSLPPDRLSKQLERKDMKYIAVLKMSSYYLDFENAPSLLKTYENKYITIYKAVK
jgi:hypothetical protein